MAEDGTQNPTQGAELEITPAGPPAAAAAAPLAEAAASPEAEVKADVAEESGETAAPETEAVPAAEPSETAPVAPAAPSVPQVEPLSAPAPTATVSVAPAVSPNDSPGAPISTTPAPQGPAMPSAEPASEAPESNVFSELFGKDQAVQGGASLMDTVSKQSGDKGPYFGEKPTLGEAPNQSPYKKNSKGGDLVLKVGMLLIVGVLGFFYTQNSPRFSLLGVNPANRALLAQEQMLELRAEVQVQQHLSAVLLLEQYTTLSDDYFYHRDQANSDYTSENKRDEHEATAASQREELVVILDSLQDKLEDDLDTEELGDARAVVDGLIRDLQTKEGEVDASTLLQDLQDLESTRTLLGKSSFKRDVSRIDLEDASEEELEAVASDYADISESVSSIISGIRSERIEWTTYFEEIEDLTKSVDPLFNTEYPGNIYLSEVSFEASGDVSVSGYSSTDDTRNFTLISNLIDAYENSTLFEQVEERSYTKNEDSEEAYTGNFRIDLLLEDFLNSDD